MTAKAEVLPVAAGRRQDIGIAVYEIELQPNLYEQQRKILPSKPVAAAYSGVPERLPRSARHIHLIFHLAEQFEELRKSDLPEEKRFF